MAGMTPVRPSLILSILLLSGLVCGCAHNQQQQTSVQNPQAATLAVTLHDPWNATVPAVGLGHVKLYSGSSLLQEADTDSSHKAQFNDLQPGQYRYEAYSRDDALQATEYWGQASRSLFSGEHASEDIGRLEPFVDTVTGIYGLPYAYGERWTKDNRGEQLNATVTVKTLPTGETGLVSVQILFDSDMVMPAELTLDCGTPVMGRTDQDVSFSCSFYPFYSVLAIGANYNYTVLVYQNGILTYVRPWLSAFATATHVCGSPPHLCG